MQIMGFTDPRVPPLVTLTLLCLDVLSFVESDQRPNIIFILADDLGYNDVPYNNPSIIAPNLMKLSKEGLLIDEHYVQPVCTPSRAALMTGIYPFRMGRQHKVLRMLEPTGIPKRYKMLPRALQEVGYITHMIGKWHLGFCSEEYIPTRRGFDTFLGYYGGAINYYTCMTGQDPEEPVEGLFPGNQKQTNPLHLKSIGYDLRRNESLYRKQKAFHNAYLYGNEAEKLILQHDKKKPFFLYLSLQQPHTPLQADKYMKRHYSKSLGKDRRNYLGLVSSIDDTIGVVLDALKKAELENNTIVIFTSDNGGADCCGGENHPLRGVKNTLFEGGTRAPAIFYYPKMKEVTDGVKRLMHITDWYPTLMKFAEGSAPSYVDGVNQYDMLMNNAKTTRQEVVYNIDEQVPFRAALRQGRYKVMVNCMPINIGNVSVKSRHICEDCLHDVHIDHNCQLDDGTSFLKIRLYDLKADPGERKNLARNRIFIANKLLKRLEYHMKSLNPVTKLDDAPEGIPRKPQFIYGPGWCNPVY